MTIAHLYLVRIGFWSHVSPNGSERPIFGPKWPKCIFWAKFGQIHTLDRDLEGKPIFSECWIELNYLLQWIFTNTRSALFFLLFLLRHFFRTRVLNFDPVQRLLLLKTLIENKKRASIAMREIYTDINQLWCPLSKTVMSIVQMNPNHSFSETWKKQDKTKQLLFASNVSNVNFVVVISQQIFLTSCKNIHSVVVSCSSTFSGFFSSSVDWSVDSIDSCARSSDPEVIRWVLMIPLSDQEQTAEVRFI